MTFRPGVDSGLHGAKMDHHNAEGAMIATLC